MANKLASRRYAAAIALAGISFLVTSCGSQGDTGAASTTAPKTTVPAETTSTAQVATEETPLVDAAPIADRQPEIEPAARAMFAFVEGNADVCPAEFETFNVIYPEDDPDRAAQLDAGIEHRGEALMECLDTAGETNMSASVALLTAWGRHLADSER